MPSEHPIADMHIFPLQRAAGTVTLLRNSDHLLKRFGQLDVLELKAGEQTAYTVRGEADRFVFPIEGSLTVRMVDQRDSSPTCNSRAEAALSAAELRGVLVPFGVACQLSADSPARAVLLSTHSENHAGDRVSTDDEINTLRVQ